MQNKWGLSRVSAKQVGSDRGQCSIHWHWISEGAMQSKRGLMGNTTQSALRTSRIEPAAEAAALPPGKASPSEVWVSIACAALPASTAFGKAKKAEGLPHWGPPPPSMKKSSSPACQHVADRALGPLEGAVRFPWFTDCDG